MDWCNTEGMVPQEAYGNMSAALNATGRHMHLNMCEWGRENPWEWGGAIAQSWRMSGDHTGRWSSTKDLISDRPHYSGGGGIAGCILSSRNAFRRSTAYV